MGVPVGRVPWPGQPSRDPRCSPRCCVYAPETGRCGWTHTAVFSLLPASAACPGRPAPPPLIPNRLWSAAPPRGTAAPPARFVDGLTRSSPRPGCRTAAAPRIAPGATRLMNACWGRCPPARPPAAHRACGRRDPCGPGGRGRAARVRRALPGSPAFPAPAPANRPAKPAPGGLRKHPQACETAPGRTGQPRGPGRRC